MRSGSDIVPETRLRDRVTFSLYGTEENPASVNNAIRELSNICTINQKLAQAARTAHNQPPEIVISVLVIPHWEKGSHYEHINYLIKKNKYFSQLRAFFDEQIKPLEDESVIIEDFYEEGHLHQYEKDYLDGLIAKGSNADMIKTHAIICDDNVKRCHLQMDTNTKIFDFDLLYNLTFGQQAQNDALNASYYDPLHSYVSAHNKIVYTTVYTPANSQLCTTLRDVHKAYCEAHAQDHIHPGREIEKIKKNSIYSKDFVIALERLGLTTKKILNAQSSLPKTVYLAALHNAEAYRLTRCVSTAVNMSWAAEHPDPEVKIINEEFKRLPPVPVGDALCDYACFANAILKHADTFDDHIGEGEYDDTRVRSEFMAISSPLEKRLIRDFLNKVKAENPQMLKNVMDTMRLLEPRGHRLFIEIFNCEPDEYVQTPVLSPQPEKRMK